MSNNFQNPQLQQTISQIQMQQQPIHLQHYQNIAPGLGGPNAMGNLNSPLVQNQKNLQHQLNQLKSPQRQQSIPQQIPLNQPQGYNQPQPMIRQPPHSKYFYKGNIDYPSCQTFLPIEKFGELLINALNSLKKIKFEPVYVDKPKEGSIFIIFIPKNDENIIDIPSDGYGWLDDEKLLKSIPIDNDKELDCYERKLGFSENQLFCTISRRRFRLRSRNYSTIEMLQYTKLRDNVPVIPSQVKVQPQNIRLVAGYPPQSQQVPQQQMQQQIQSQQQQIQSQQQYYQMQQQQHYKQNMNQMNKQSIQQQYQQSQQPYSMSSRPNTPQRRKTNSYRNDDDDNDKNLSGDELDVLQARDISIGRYRRNHDYMSEILSPYNIDSIEPPEIININNRESLNNEVEKLNKEIEILEKEMAEKSKKSDSFIQTINKISKCKTEEELQKITNEVNKSLDIQLVPKTDVRKVKI